VDAARRRGRGRRPPGRPASPRAGASGRTWRGSRGARPGPRTASASGPPGVPAATAPQEPGASGPCSRRPAPDRAALHRAPRHPSVSHSHLRTDSTMATLRRTSKPKRKGKDKSEEADALPPELRPADDIPTILTPAGSFDIDDPDLPDWVADEALASGGYPYRDRL